MEKFGFNLVFSTLWFGFSAFKKPGNTGINIAIYQRTILINFTNSASRSHNTYQSDSNLVNLVYKS